MRYLVLLLSMQLFQHVVNGQHENKNIGDYLFRDNISKSIVVSAAGDGDFKTIGEALKSIQSSSFDNQYEVLVRPGKYKESSLTLPPFTHLKGIGGIHDVTIYDDKVRAPWIVDQRHSSKMSNLTLDITNSEAYVIHYDAPTLANAITVNTNLNIIHRGGDIGASVIGGGSWENYLSVWQDCYFVGEKGQPACHTKQNSRNSMDLRFINCSFSSGFAIGAVGGYERSKLTFQNCSFAEPCTAFISLIKNEPELWKYPANNLEWNIFGSNNKGFILDISHTKNKGECIAITAKAFNKNISISGSAAEILFGTHASAVIANNRIKGTIKGSADVRDVQSGLLKYSAPKDVIQMWKRLGDCTSEPKELIVTIGNTTERFRFDQNYLKERTPEKEILRDLNGKAKEIVFTKEDGVNVYDILDMPEKKMVLVAESDGILPGEFIIIDRYKALRANSSTPLFRLEGIAVSSAAQKELITSWKGDFFIELPDGEYGIGQDFKLSKSSSLKIGVVRNKIFHPYY